MGMGIGTSHCCLFGGGIYPRDMSCLCVAIKDAILFLLAMKSFPHHTITVILITMTIPISTTVGIVAFFFHARGTVGIPNLIRFSIPPENTVVSATKMFPDRRGTCWL